MTSPGTFRRFAPLAVVVLLVSACGLLADKVSPTADTDATGAPGVPGPSEIYSQSVHWSTCGELECATVQVPLDWSNPDGQTIGIALNRHAAEQPDNRIGSLLINPGGPGGSGLELTQYFVVSAGERLLDHYDVVGFDPRGVGQSAPIVCGDGPDLDAYYVEDVDIETQADIDAARERAGVFAAECRERSGPVIEHIDTVSAARDMDVIRAVLGDAELHYLGFSYGTQLGATYAQLYPDNVGRIVLDGAVDFLLPPEELSSGQAEGFERALTNFLEWCTTMDDCELDSDVDEARRQIRDIALTARDEGYPSGTRWDVNGNLMVYGIVVTLYDEANWEFLKLAINEVLTVGTARYFYDLANFYLDRDGMTGEYLGNSTVAFTAIGCLDEGYAEPWVLEELREYQRDAEEYSPTFGWWFAAGLGCDGWPWEAGEYITSLDAAAKAAPMLVIGTTNDPATPFEWAESLSERLGAPLLIWEGDGHTAYGRSNDCVTDVVDEFLVDGILPASGTRC